MTVFWACKSLDGQPCSRSSAAARVFTDEKDHRELLEPGREFGSQHRDAVCTRLWA